MKILKVLVLSIATAVTVAGAASAAPLSQNKAQTLLLSGELAFHAGSKANFRADGSFEFKHGSKREKGTFVVNADGSVSCFKKNGKPYYSFVVDVAADGKKSVQYLTGRYKGKSFSFE